MAGLQVSFDCAGRPPSTSCDLQLNCYPDGDGILGRIIYNADLFDAGTVERLAAASRPARTGRRRPRPPPVRPHRTSPRSERAVIEAERHAERASPRRQRSASCSRPRRRAARRRRRRHDGRQVTYARARRDRRPDRALAAGRRRRTRRGRRRVPAARVPLIAALLGVLQGGAAYVPLDPATRATRLAFMLADSGAVRRADRRGRPPASCRRRRPRSSTWTTRRARPDAAPWTAAPGRGRPAYLIYTSGSTGTPKGVLVEHAALVHPRRLRCSRSTGSAPADRVLQFASIGFDTHVEEIFPACWPAAGCASARPVDLPAAAGRADRPRAHRPGPADAVLARPGPAGRLRRRCACRTRPPGRHRRRRGRGRPPCGAWRPPGRRAPGEHLRPDRGHRRAPPAAELTGDDPATVRAHRPADRQRARVRPGPATAAGAGRRARRAVPRRRRAWPAATSAGPR